LHYNFEEQCDAIGDFPETYRLSRRPIPAGITRLTAESRKTSFTGKTGRATWSRISLQNKSTYVIHLWSSDLKIIQGKCLSTGHITLFRLEFEERR